MTWKTRPPKGRVWALVLVKGGSNVPFVAQYEPRSCTWTIAKFQDMPLTSFAAKDCEWHELPQHESFHEKTHAIEERDC